MGSRGGSLGADLVGFVWAFVFLVEIPLSFSIFELESSLNSTSVTLALTFPLF